ncbi:MAG: DUF3604 domain-containing protein [Pirellulales bacterium]
MLVFQPLKKLLVDWALIGMSALTLTVLTLTGSNENLWAHSHTAKELPNFQYDAADETIVSTVLGERLEYDADVVVLDAARWIAWLEFTRGKGDRIWVGRNRDTRAELRKLVTLEHGSYANPTLTCDHQQRLWLSYEQEQDGQWDLFVLRLADGSPADVPIRVSQATGADIRHVTVADGQGGIWFVWQSDQSGQFDILARKLEVSTGSLGSVEIVSTQSLGDWHPHAAIDSHGTVMVVWDAFDGESFNVHLRRRQRGHWGDMVNITRSPSFSGRSQVAVDQKDRVWVGWEEGAENWGRPFRGIETLAITDQHGPLHRYRRLHLALVDAEKGVHPVADPLPMPSLKLAAERTHENTEVRWSGTYYERPRLTVDGRGRVWLAYRHYYCPWLGVEHRSHVESGWAVYARSYGADGWSSLYRFDIGQGDGMQSLEIAPSQEGICAVWTTGRTHRTESKGARGIVAASIQGQGMGVGAEVPTLEFSGKSSANIRPKRRRRKTDSAGGKTHQLFYGDLHRHTDLSLCRVPYDGTIDDAYRYAIEVAGLDFLGITDHSRDIAKGDTLSQLWWRCQKGVTRHQLNGTFFPFFSYERSHGNTADHNVISLRPDLLRPHTYPVPVFWRELDQNTITIPHQPIRRDTWAYQDDRLRPLVEIYQGCRDQSIEEHVHRGLAKGYHLGFIASSDHMSTSASYACVWANEASRESIFRALQQRRTYGATTNIRLVVHAGDHWMGQQIVAEKMPPIVLKATGTAPFRLVELVVDGEVHETLLPNAREVEITRTIHMAGVHYFYFHLTQIDGNEAWSSPIWLKSPDTKPRTTEE